MGTASRSRSIRRLQIVCPTANIDDLEPVGLVAQVPNVVTVNPKVTAKTVADLWRSRKQSPAS